jgi:hypothetical protein
MDAQLDAMRRRGRFVGPGVPAAGGGDERQQA